MKNKIITIFIIMLLLCVAVPAYPIKNNIMEMYYDDGEYQYVINTATDVVYIKDKSAPGYLVPLYKPDGNLMTGKELKVIVDGIDEIVIYEESDS